MHHLFLCVLPFLFVERAWFEQSVGKIDLTEVRWGVMAEGGDRRERDQVGEV